MRMRNEQRRRQRFIGSGVAIKGIRPAIDQQLRFAIAFEHDRRRSQFDRVGRAHSEKMKMPIHAVIASAWPCRNGLPDVALEGRLINRRAPDLEQRPTQSLQVGLLPDDVRHALTPAIKIDQMKLSWRHQYIVGVQVGMPDPGAVESPDQSTHLPGQSRVQLPRREALGQRLRIGDMPSDQVGGVEKTPTPVACRDG